MHYEYYGKILILYLNDTIKINYNKNLFLLHFLWFFCNYVVLIIIVLFIIM